MVETGVAVAMALAQDDTLGSIYKGNGISTIIVPINACAMYANVYDNSFSLY